VADPIRVRRDVQLPPDAVFGAWTHAERLAAWWWPHLPDTEYAVDAHAGGRYRIWTETAGIGTHGEYSVVEPPRRLEFTWNWDGGAGHPPEAVVVTIEPDGNGSTVTVEHACSSTDPNAIGDLEQGWRDILGRLAALEP
jgi:uncharacterized protein YndB with AHSA1/START domain